MCKQEFLDQLRARLGGLPHRDVEERLNFYGEMIDDRMEEGRSEDEAVSDIGSVEEIAAQIVSEIPLAKIATQRLKPNRHLRVWEIALLIIGSPIWLALAVAALAGLVALYATLWSLIVSVWAVFVSLAASGLGGIAAGGAFAFGGQTHAGVAVIGTGLVCVGLAIFAFFGCKAATRGTVSLTKTIVLGIKKCLVRREASV